MLLKPVPGLLAQGGIAPAEELGVAGGGVARGHHDDGHVLPEGADAQPVQLLIAVGMPGLGHLLDGLSLPVVPDASQPLQVLRAHHQAQLVRGGIVVEAVLPHGPLAVFHEIKVHDAVAPAGVQPGAAEIAGVVGHQDLVVLHPCGLLLAHGLEDHGVLDGGDGAFILFAGSGHDQRALRVHMEDTLPDPLVHDLHSFRYGAKLIHPDQPFLLRGDGEQSPRFRLPLTGPCPPARSPAFWGRTKAFAAGCAPWRPPPGAGRCPAGSWRRRTGTGCRTPYVRQRDTFLR